MKKKPFFPGKKLSLSKELISLLNQQQTAQVFAGDVGNNTDSSKVSNTTVCTHWPPAAASVCEHWPTTAQ